MCDACGGMSCVGGWRLQRIGVRLILDAMHLWCSTAHVLWPQVWCGAYYSIVSAAADGCDCIALAVARHCFRTFGADYYCMHVSVLVVWRGCAAMCTCQRKHHDDIAAFACGRRQH